MWGMGLGWLVMILLDVLGLERANHPHSSHLDEFKLMVPLNDDSSPWQLINDIKKCIK